MRKVNLMLLLFTCFMLVACGSETNEKGVANETQKQSVSKFDEEQIDNIINGKIAELNLEGNYGEFDDEFAVVRFYQNDVPQILTINEVDSTSIISVHMFDEAKEEWKVSYVNKEHNSYDGTDRLHILDKGPLDEKNELEHAVIGLNSGSGGYLNFFILGQNGGEIVKVLDKMALNAYQGHVYIEEKEVVIESEGAVVERISISESLSTNEYAVNEEVEKKNVSPEKTYKPKLGIKVPDYEVTSDMTYGWNTGNGFIDGVHFHAETMTYDEAELAAIAKEIIETYYDPSEENLFKDYIEVDIQNANDREKLIEARQIFVDIEGYTRKMTYEVVSDKVK